jgi:hypothetical protein
VQSTLSVLNARYRSSMKITISTVVSSSHASHS